MATCLQGIYVISLSGGKKGDNYCLLFDVTQKRYSKVLHGCFSSPLPTTGYVKLPCCESGNVKRNIGMRV